MTDGTTKELDDALIVVERSGTYLVSELGHKVSPGSTLPGAMCGGLGNVGSSLSMAGLREEVYGLTLSEVLERANEDSGSFSIHSFGNQFEVTVKELIYGSSGDKPAKKTWEEYIKSNRAEFITN